MSTPQSRGIRVPYQQSQSQPIPARQHYQQSHYAANQAAYSPRPAAGPHSSSPINPPYYQQVPPHEMFKQQVGTPPSMMPMHHQYHQYMNGVQQRPRMPHSAMAAQQVYYQPPLMRFPNSRQQQQSVPNPHQPQFYAGNPQAVQQYQMMPQMQPQQQPGPPMTYQAQAFTPQQYSQPPQPHPHPNMQPVSTPAPMPLAQTKRERKLIRIVDPSTMHDVTADIMKSSESPSTPASGRSSATPPSIDVAARFAAQVAQVAGPKKGSAPHMQMNPNASFTQPEQIGSSPNLVRPGAIPSPGQTYVANIMPAGPYQDHSTNQSKVVIASPKDGYQLPSQNTAMQLGHTHTQSAIQPQKNIPDNVHTLPTGPIQIQSRPAPIAQSNSNLSDAPKSQKDTSAPVTAPPVVAPAEPVSTKPPQETPISTPAACQTVSASDAENSAPAPQEEKVSDETEPVAMETPVEAIKEEVATTKHESGYAPQTEDTAIRLEPPENIEQTPDFQSVKESDTSETVSPVEQPVDNTPQINIDPPTPIQSKSEKEATPIPPAKPVVESASEDAVNSPEENVIDRQPMTEPEQPVSLPSPETKPLLEDTPVAVKCEQNVTEHVAVNGISADALTDSVESEPPENTKKEDSSSLKDKVPEQKIEEKSKETPKAIPDKIESMKVNGEPESKKGEIRYTGEEQWTPNNQEGKRHYDSDFLLQFQYRPASMEKPKDLPNIECVLAEPHKQVAAPMQPMDLSRGGSDFIPPYMRQGSGGQNRGPPRRQNSRDQRGYGRQNQFANKPQKQIIISTTEVKLKTTANAWKPQREMKEKLSQEDKETQDIIREVRAILNKITPSTFSELMVKIRELKIDTERKLKGTIDLIFEKAIDEPNFSEAYANMCRKMTTLRVTPEESTDNPNPTATVEFRKLLLTRCQREFEKNKSDQEHLQELKKKMEENKDPELAPVLKDEFETAEYKERRRTLGNIRFIGELFKLRMLTEGIMHNCIMTLFKAKDDDHLESLCRLLTTIGKDLDHAKGKPRMDQYFDQIRKIIAEKRTSSRVRFMLQDVDDLRSNNWVPRAIQTQGPKTISQIHQDAKEEQEKLQLQLATTPTPAPNMKGGRGQSRMSGNRSHGEDGWTKVQNAPKPTRFDPTKMKLMKPTIGDGEKFTLGPSRGYGGWKSGSAGSGVTRTGSSGYSPSSSMDRTPEGRSNTPTNMMNRFSALQGSQGSNTDYDYQRRSGGRHGSREGSRSGSRGSMGPPSSGPRTPRRDERSVALEAARKLTSGDRSQERRRQSSRESSPSVPKRRATPPPKSAPTHKYADLNEEKMQQKSKNILEEFLSIVDFKEATECIEELNASPDLMHCFVYVTHEFTLEKKREERVNVGRLMAHLLKRGRLSVSEYVKGLAELLELATDYEIDVPKVWEYFAEQLSPVFADENESDISLSILGQLAAPLQEEDRSGVFVAEIVKAIIRQGNLQSTISRWQRSKLLWSKIIGKDETAVKSFLKQHNLEDLADGEGSSQEVERSEPVQRNSQFYLERELTKLLKENRTNDQIFDWVEDNLNEDERAGSAFLRALTMSVCKRSLENDAQDIDKMNVNEDRISERSLLLKKYIGGELDQELQVLYALQRLMVELEQPRDVLRKLFDVFYNEDVLQEQSFYKWEKSDDPNEQEGRGVSVASVNMFFTWLRTAEPESE